MAYLGDFDASTIEPADFSALPAGDYTAIISASEFKLTKTHGGQYLALTFQIVDGPYQGRYLWHNLNLKNANPKAEEIAQRELSAICRATGQMRITDSNQLHDIPMKIAVAYLPPKGEFPEKNAIKKWEPTGVAAAKAAKPSAPATGASAHPAAKAAQPSAPATGASVPPWKRSSPTAAAADNPF